VSFWFAFLIAHPMGETLIQILSRWVRMLFGFIIVIKEDKDAFLIILPGCIQSHQYLLNEKKQDRKRRLLHQILLSVAYTTIHLIHGHVLQQKQFFLWIVLL